MHADSAAEIHQDHRLWASHVALWRDDLRAWQDELSAVQSELEGLQAALAREQEALRQHAAALRSFEQEAGTHEHALASLERGRGGAELTRRPVTHGEEAVQFDSQRQRHEALRRRQHTWLAHWRALLKSLAE